MEAVGAVGEAGAIGATGAVGTAVTIGAAGTVGTVKTMGAAGAVVTAGAMGAAGGSSDGFSDSKINLYTTPMSWMPNTVFNTISRKSRSSPLMC